VKSSGVEYRGGLVYNVTRHSSRCPFIQWHVLVVVIRTVIIRYGCFLLGSAVSGGDLA